MIAALDLSGRLVLLEPLWLLGLLFLVPLAFGRAPSVQFSPTPMAVSLPRSLRSRLVRVPGVLTNLGFACGVFALAGPALRGPLPLEAEGIDILIAVDRSSSMEAKDMDPERTRLDVAREAAAGFVSGRAEDRIGLVGFARYADVICPLTLSHGSLLKLLDTVQMVEPEGPEDATGIGSAVARAADILRKSESPSKVVILFTDGEETVASPDDPASITPARAAALCRELGVRVYSIAAGVGATTRAGNLVPLDTGPIRALAEATGGAFFEARDADATSRVYQAIDELERVRFLEPRFRTEEIFELFVAAAIALVLSGRLLGSTVLEVLP